MAGFPQVGDCMAWARGNAKTSTRHIAKISIALINIPLGNYCLVRQRATPANFSEDRAIFSERNFEVFCSLGCSRTAKKCETHLKTERMRVTNHARRAMRGLLTKAAG
jgi:hypothetical protein